MVLKSDDRKNHISLVKSFCSWYLRGKKAMRKRKTKLDHTTFLFILNWNLFLHKVKSILKSDDGRNQNLGTFLAASPPSCKTQAESVISVGADLITPLGDADQPKVDTILYDHTCGLLFI